PPPAGARRARAGFPHLSCRRRGCRRRRPPRGTRRTARTHPRRATPRRRSTVSEQRQRLRRSQSQHTITGVIVRFVLWNLADSKTNVAELRRHLRDEAVDAFEELPGLLFKA